MLLLHFRLFLECLALNVGLGRGALQLAIVIAERHSVSRGLAGLLSLLGLNFPGRLALGLEPLLIWGIQIAVPLEFTSSELVKGLEGAARLLRWPADKFVSRIPGKGSEFGPPPPIIKLGRLL